MKNNKQRQMMKNIAKWIFSIGNDNRNFQKNKFIIIFGFKIYLTTFKLQLQLFLQYKYHKYLENNINQIQNDFVGITNEPYKVSSMNFMKDIYCSVGGGGKK